MSVKKSTSCQISGRKLAIVGLAIAAVCRAVLLRGASASGPCPSELALNLVCSSTWLRSSALRPSEVTDSFASLQWGIFLPLKGGCICHWGRILCPSLEEADWNQKGGQVSVGSGQRQRDSLRGHFLRACCRYWLPSDHAHVQTAP